MRGNAEIGAGGPLPPGSSAAGGAPASDPRRLKRPWPPEDQALLRMLWADNAIARQSIPGRLERSANAVDEMARRLKLGPRGVKPRPEGGWTEEEDDVLRHHWHINSRQWIAEKLGRKPGSVSNRATRLQLGSSQFSSALGSERSRATMLRMLAETRAKPFQLRRTPERRAVLEQAWPAGVDVQEILARLQALPGPEIDRSFVGNWARDLKLRRPEGFQGTRSAPSAPLAIERPKPVEKVARRCLCCARQFDAPGRFIRLCDVCRKHSEGMV